MLEQHYIKSRLPMVEREIECFGYCTMQAYVLAGQGEIDKAKAYMDNALRSLEFLRKEAEYKNYADKAILMLKEMDPADAWRYLHAR